MIKTFFQINITAQNLLTQERHTVIVNTEVTKIAINYNGTWMVTLEERDDKISSIEIRLKFWEFDLEKQTLVNILNFKELERIN